MEVGRHGEPHRYPPFRGLALYWQQRGKGSGKEAGGVLAINAEVAILPPPHKRARARTHTRTRTHTHALLLRSPPPTMTKAR